MYSLYSKAAQGQFFLIFRSLNDILFGMVYRKTFNPDPEEVHRACRIPLHPDAEAGIELYNRGEYFLAHEALEDAWNDEGDPERRLYQGILQAGVLCMHARKGNYQWGVVDERPPGGMAGPLAGPLPHGLDIGQLKADIAHLVQQVEQLGPENIDKIDQRLFTKIERGTQ